MIFDKEDYKAFDPELWNAIDAEAIQVNVTMVVQT